MKLPASTLRSDIFAKVAERKNMNSAYLSEKRVDLVHPLFFMGISTKGGIYNTDKKRKGKDKA
jgi:hypothetical protein